MRPPRPGQGVAGLLPGGGQGGPVRPAGAGQGVGPPVRTTRAVRTGWSAEHRVPDIVVRTRVPGIVDWCARSGRCASRAVRNIGCSTSWCARECRASSRGTPGAARNIVVRTRVESTVSRCAPEWSPPGVASTLHSMECTRCSAPDAGHRPLDAEHRGFHSVDDARHRHHSQAMECRTPGQSYQAAVTLASLLMWRDTFTITPGRRAGASAGGSVLVPHRPSPAGPSRPGRRPSPCSGRTPAW